MASARRRQSVGKIKDPRYHRVLGGEKNSCKTSTTQEAGGRRERERVGEAGKSAAECSRAANQTGAGGRGA